MPPFLGPKERLELIRNGIHSPNHAIHKRATAIRMLDAGQPLYRVAREIHCDRNSIYRWIAKFQEFRDADPFHDARTKAGRRAAALRRPQRTQQILDLINNIQGRAGHPNSTTPTSGRLNLEPNAQAQLQRTAQNPDHPLDCYQAAIILAVDSHIPVAQIARAAGACRSTIYDLTNPKRLPKILQNLPPT